MLEGASPSPLRRSSPRPRAPAPNSSCTLRQLSLNLPFLRGLWVLVPQGLFLVLYRCARRVRLHPCACAASASQGQHTHRLLLFPPCSQVNATEISTQHKAETWRLLQGPSPCFQRSRRASDFLNYVTPSVPPEETRGLCSKETEQPEATERRIPVSGLPQGSHD